MIRDLCKMVKIAFQPVKSTLPPKYKIKTVVGSAEILHVRQKTHFPELKDTFVRTSERK